MQQSAITTPQELRYPIIASQQAHRPRDSRYLFIIPASITFTNPSQALLYGSNTYIFSTHGDPHPTGYLEPALTLGPFGNPGFETSGICNLRSITINVTLSSHDRVAAKRQLERLRLLTDVLKEHTDGDDHTSLLQSLAVNVKPNRASSSREMDGCVASIESLATLRGIKRVEVTGVPEWWGKCLQLCIQGQGGGVHKLDEVEVRRRKRFRGKKRKWWCQLMLAWREFAEQNGIEVSEDAEGV